MKDAYGRKIEYMRLSITDRCDLRCAYCMPELLPSIPHSDILRYEELLRLAAAAEKLGITKFKVTGGEPFARLGAADFISELKTLPGIECVTVTTNGMQLQNNLETLKNAGIDGINISLDAIDPELYHKITGIGDAKKAVESIKCAAASGIPTKINTVLLDENINEWLKIIRFADELNIDVRFIELMPMGHATGKKGPKISELENMIIKNFGVPKCTDEKRGNGPASYFTVPGLKSKIGIIGATTRRFCEDCNRVRLTASGVLKPCLCFETGTDLKPFIKRADDKELLRALKNAIYNKPAQHCFDKPSEDVELKSMNQIGG